MKVSANQIKDYLEKVMGEYYAVSVEYNAPANTYNITVYCKFDMERYRGVPLIIKSVEKSLYNTFGIPDFCFTVKVVPYYGGYKIENHYRSDIRPISTREDVVCAVEDIISGIILQQSFKFTLESVVVNDLLYNGVCEVLITVSGNNIEGFRDFIYSEIVTGLKSLLGSACKFTRFDVRLNYQPVIQPAFLELKLGCKSIKEENNMRQIPEIKNLIHSGDYTHIIWEDGTKTSVKREENTPYDAYGAFAQAVVKKLYGSTEKAKFEHTLKQLPIKEQKKVLAEKKAHKEKQERAEKKKIDRQLKREEEELREKEEQVKATRAKRKSLFKSSEV